MSWNSENFSSTVKIGDYITLKQTTTLEGFLCAEGIITEDVILSQDGAGFENCLWEVHVQNQYTAVREYEEVLFNKLSDEGSAPISDEDNGPLEEQMKKNEDLVDQLHRAATNEGRLNEKLMAMKVGKPVSFGDVIQLRHVKSKKFLTINTALAKSERENIRVSLEGYGDSMSWLVFMPRSKADREGQHLVNSSEALLRVHERPTEFIHCARKISQSKGFGDREINCSLESSCWTINIFQHARESLSNSILAGQLVTFQEPESSSYLCLDKDNSHVSLQHSNVLSFTKAESDVGTNLLWLVEKHQHDRGGSVGHKGDKITLRHLNTGLYACIENSSVRAVSTRDKCSLFDIQSGQGLESYGLVDQAMIQLSHDGAWVHTPIVHTRSSIIEVSIGRTRASSSPESPVKRKAIHSTPLAANNRPCAVVKEKALATYLTVSNKLQQTLGVDVFVGVEGNKILRKFESAARSKSILLENTGYIENFMKLIFNVLDTLFQFLTDDMLDAVMQNAEMQKDKDVWNHELWETRNNAKASAIRQAMMREQGVLSSVIDIIELCGNGTFSELPELTKKIKDPGKVKTPSLRALSRNFQSLQSMVSTIEEENGDGKSSKNVLLASAVSKPTRPPVSRQSSQQTKAKVFRHRAQSMNSGEHEEGSKDRNESFVGRDRSSSTTQRERKDSTPVPSPRDRPRKLTIDTSSRGNSQVHEEEYSDDEDRDEGTNQQSDGGSDLTPIRQDTNFHTLTRDIATSCFRLLLAIIHDNHANQMYIADKFPILLNQVKDQELAVVCVQEMLRDNLQMLQTKVREREIEIFLHLLEQSEMNVTLLNLLRSTCSCPMGVDSTQRLVANALFQPIYANKRTMLDSLHAAAANFTKAEETLPPEVATSIANNSVRPVEEKSSENVRVQSLMVTPRDQITRASFTFSGSAPKRCLLVTVKMNTQNRVKNIVWSQRTVYMPQNPKDIAQIKGYSLVTEGLPHLTLNWELGIDGYELSMLHLFGFSKDVPFECLQNLSRFAVINSLVQDSSSVVTKQTDPLKRTRVSISHTHKRATANKRFSRVSIAGKTRVKGKTKHNTSRAMIGRKVQVLDYFCAQLYLLADLCLDRNYVAMNLVERQFPYEMLITMLKHPTAQSRIKAPVCRLLRCLYVDRDPQVEEKFPRLIRTSVSLEGGDDSDDFKMDRNGTPYAFALLQQIIVEYINDSMDMTQCDELSSEMIDLLLALMRFGFYSNVIELQDIISTLGKTLEDHKNSSRKQTTDGSFSESSGGGSRTIVSMESSDNHASMKNTQNGAWGRITMLFASWKKGEKDGNSRITPEGNGIIQSNHALERMFGNSTSVAPAPQGASNGVSTPRRLTSSSSADARRLKSSLSSEGTVSKQLLNKSWQGKTLTFMESSTYIFFILVAVLTSTSVVVATWIIGDMTVLTGIDIAVAVIFFSELACRMYCTYFVHKELLSFLTNPYKLFDVLVVMLDIAMLITGGLSVRVNSAVRITKTLRILRILRLIRLIRAARLIRRITKKTVPKDIFKLPSRYLTSSEYETRTLTGIIRILSVAHDRLQDRKLGMVIQKFSGWFDDTIRNKGVDAKRLYEQVCIQNNLSGSFPEQFGDVLLDVIMYSDPVLVQEALKLLMVHQCSEGRFISTAERVQIIYSTKLEHLYKSLIEDLTQIKVLAESFELWCDFATEKDAAAAKNLLDILLSICAHATRKTDARKLDCDATHYADKEAQQLLYNMDAMSTFMCVQHALCDEGLSHKDTRIDEIIRACNDLIIVFVDCNEVNQVVAFPYLEWFLERIDDTCHSSKVAKAIISGNRSLIKQCPRSYVADMVQKIVSHGRQPMYLDLLIGLTDVEDNGDSAILSIRSEVSKYITNRERAQFVVAWCDGPGETGYEQRVVAMAQFLEAQQENKAAQLSPQLQYHINFLELLAGCKLGQKLQAVYAAEDYIAAIIDPRTLSSVRRVLGLLLLDMIETRVEGIEGSESVWKFFDYASDYHRNVTEKIHEAVITKENFHMKQDIVEWMKITLMIIISFFDNFDFLTFRDLTLFESDLCFDTTQRTEADIQLLIESLYSALRSVYRSNQGLLGPVIWKLLDAGLTSLGQLCADGIDDDRLGASNAVQYSLVPPTKTRRRSLKRQTTETADALHEAFYRKQFGVFLASIKADKERYFEASVNIMEKLPSVHDPVKSDIRLEPFLSKITSHIRSRMQRTSSTMTMDRTAVDTTLWLIETWTLILYQNLEVDIESLVDPTKFSQRNMKPSPFQSIMNANGVTVLCIDLISVGVDHTLVLAALKLLTVLLVKCGGHHEVQNTIHAYLSQIDSTLFFELLKDLLEQQMTWCQREADIRRDMVAFDEVPDDVTLPDEAIVLKLIHSMCDGGHVDNKNIIREQSGNTRWVNLLDYVGSYADLISRLESHACTRMGIRVMHTALGVMQGPCKGNQEHFVLHTNLLSALNRIMRSSQSVLNYSYEWADDLELLKEFVIDTLLASIEGHSEGSVVLERVQLSMEINVLNVLILPSEIDDDGNLVELKELSPLQAKYLVFLQALDYTEANIPLNARARLEHDIVSIEVVWNRQVFRQFFHLPKISTDISQVSKNRLIEEVDLSSQELKLKDFMRIAKDLHREALHHQTLNAYGLSNIWNYKGTLSWLMLVNAFAINVLLAVFYKTSPDTWNLHLPDEVQQALATMIIIQIIGAACALTMSVIARLPVLYWSFMDNGKSKLWAICYAVVDPVTFWHYIYFTLAVLSLLKSPLFSSALLLDFVVMDSTSRDVLNAVIYPARQLATAIFIILIMVNIFAGVIFSQYRNDFDLDGLDGSTLWDTIKLSITYGVRANEGVGAYMTPNISGRFGLDMCFYVTITVVLLNIFFGIIIDTFGKLRNLKVERELDQANKCFICGVDVHDFVKKGISSSIDVSFKQHRRERHNLWNYLYFAMHIWEQHRDQDSSVEYHVRQCMEAGDISWFPIGIMDSNIDIVKPPGSNFMYETPTEIEKWGNEYFNHQNHPDTADGDRAMKEDFEKLSAALSERLGIMQESLAHRRDSNTQVPPPVLASPGPGFTPVLHNRKRIGGGSIGEYSSSPNAAGGKTCQSPSQTNSELLGLITKCLRREMEPFKSQLLKLEEQIGGGGGGRVRQDSWAEDDR